MAVEGEVDGLAELQNGEILISDPSQFTSFGLVQYVSNLVILLEKPWFISLAEQADNKLDKISRHFFKNIYQLFI